MSSLAADFTKIQSSYVSRMVYMCSTQLPKKYKAWSISRKITSINREHRPIDDGRSTMLQIQKLNSFQKGINTPPST